MAAAVGGWDAPAVHDEVTAEDVLALNVQSVNDRLGIFAVDVLEVHGEEISALLNELLG